MWHAFDQRLDPLAADLPAIAHESRRARTRSRGVRRLAGHRLHRAARTVARPRRCQCLAHRANGCQRRPGLRCTGQPHGATLGRRRRQRDLRARGLGLCHGDSGHPPRRGLRRGAGHRRDVPLRLPASARRGQRAAHGAHADQRPRLRPVSRAVQRRDTYLRRRDLQQLHRATLPARAGARRHGPHFALQQCRSRRRAGPLQPGSQSQP